MQAVSSLDSTIKSSRRAVEARATGTKRHFFLSVFFSIPTLWLSSYFLLSSSFPGHNSDLKSSNRLSYPPPPHSGPRFHFCHHKNSTPFFPGRRLAWNYAYPCCWALSVVDSYSYECRLLFFFPGFFSCFWRWFVRL